MDLCKDTIEALSSAGIEFAAGLKAPWGQETIHLPVEDIADYVADPDGYAAKKKGVLKEDYLAWLESEGTPRCGELTAKGKRCKNWVSGGVHLRIEEWRNLDGGQCAVHGGESSEEAHLRIYGRKKY